jgi:hypothetical protein
MQQNDVANSRYHPLVPVNHYPLPLDVHVLPCLPNLRPKPKLATHLNSICGGTSLPCLATTLDV